MATSGSASIKTSSKDYGAMDPSVALAQFTAQQAPMMDMIRATTGDMVAKGESAAVATEAAGKQAAEAIRTQGTIVAIERQKAIDIAQAMGGDDVVQQAHQSRLEAMRVKDQLLPKIREESAVTPWDDPMRWIVNQFTTPTLIKAYNLANAADQEATNRIDAIHRGIAQKKAIDLAPTAALLTQQANAEANARETAALAQAEEIRVRGYQQKLQTLAQEVAMGRATLNDYLQVAQMEATAKNTAINAGIANRELLFRERALTKAEREEQDEGKILADVNASRALIGLKPLEMHTWRLYPKAEQGKMVMRAQSPTIGQTMGDAYLNVVENNAIVPLRGANPGAYDFMVKTYQSDEFKAEKNRIAALPTTSAAFAKLSDEQQDAKVMDNLQKKWAQEVKDEPMTNKLPATNPYRLNFATVTQWPELRGNFYADSMRQLQEKNPSKQWTEEDIIVMAKARAAQAFKEGKTADIAAAAKELSDFFKVGMTSQYAKGGMFAVGLSRPDTYGVSRGEGYGAFIDPKTGNPRAVQMFDPVTVQHYLMQEAVKKPPVQFGLGGFPN